MDQALLRSYLATIYEFPTATGALRALGRHHPARIVLLRPDPDQVATLDGRTSLYAVDEDGHQRSFEKRAPRATAATGPVPLA